MFLELLLYLLLGAFLGTLAGLVPGLHPNTISFLILAASPFLGLDIFFLVALVVGCEMTNAFVNFIPAILFSAPEESTAMATMPGQKLLLAGRAYEAILLSVYGGIFAAMFILILFPCFVIFIPRAYYVLKPAIVFLLLVTIIHLFWTSRRKLLPSVLVFGFSGIYGLLIFQLPISSSQVLFPTFCGLFGLSALALSSASGGIPSQEMDADFSDSSRRKSSLMSVLCGLLAGNLPGVGTSEVTVMSQEVSGTSSPKDFMITVGGIASASSIFSIIALWTLGNPRSGSSVAIQALQFEYTVWTMLLVLFMIVLSAGLGALLTLIMSRIFIRNSSRINFSKLSKIIFVFLLALVVMTTGLLGILVAATGFSIGVYCITADARRSLMMVVLIVPTLLFFLGI
ncbi:MAG: tripartite tricarboxylate transporter permease [Candidatus Aenigmarchaeota archaeon]|nr:tripartite tricarboxylate transporter permease [Candidatus Aenigmarchaeota archaeon]